jgi:hypothetical protein
VAVSDEARGSIETFIKKHNCTYDFISSKEAGKNYGIKAYPTVFTLDAHGRVATGMVSSLVSDCDVPPAADYSKKFDKALAAVRAGDWKTASTELAKLDKDNGKDGENAKALEKWIDDHGTKRVAEGDAALAEGDVFGARDAYTEVSKKWNPKADCVKAANDKLAELKKDKDAKKAFAQEKLWAQAQAAEEANDNASAAALYGKCGKAAAGTKFADFCDKKAKECQ